MLSILFVCFLLGAQGQDFPDFLDELEVGAEGGSGFSLWQEGYMDWADVQNRAPTEGTYGGFGTFGNGTYSPPTYCGAGSSLEETVESLLEEGLESNSGAMTAVAVGKKGGAGYCGGLSTTRMDWIPCINLAIKRLLVACGLCIAGLSEYLLDRKEAWVKWKADAMKCCPLKNMWGRVVGFDKNHPKIPDMQKYSGGHAGMAKAGHYLQSASNIATYLTWATGCVDAYTQWDSGYQALGRAMTQFNTDMRNGVESAAVVECLLILMNFRKASGPVIGIIEGIIGGNTPIGLAYKMATANKWMDAALCLAFTNLISIAYSARRPNRNTENEMYYAAWNYESMKHWWQGA